MLGCTVELIPDAVGAVHVLDPRGLLALQPRQPLLAVGIAGRKINVVLQAGRTAATARRLETAGLPAPRVRGGQSPLFDRRGCRRCSPTQRGKGGRGRRRAGLVGTTLAAVVGQFAVCLSGVDLQKGNI